MEMMSIYENFLNLFQSELKKLKFDPINAIDLVNASFLAKQYDLAESIRCLLSSTSKSGIPILVRSIYEAFIDQKLNNKDNNHMKKLILKEANRSKKAAKKAGEAAETTLLKAIYPTPESIIQEEKYHAELQARSNELGINGKSTIESRFSELEISDQYDSIYAYLSKFVHTSPQMISTKYFEIKDNKVSKFYLLAQLKETEIKTFLLLTMRFLSESLRICLDSLKLKSENVLNNLEKIILKLSGTADNYR